MNKLPRDIILIISKMHPLLIPPFTNHTLRRAVRNYLAGGARKKGIVDKYGEINNWDVSKVTRMSYMFEDAESFNQPLNKWDVSSVTSMYRMFERAGSFTTSRSTVIPILTFPSQLIAKSPNHQTKKSRAGHSDSDSSWYQGAWSGWCSGMDC